MGTEMHPHLITQNNSTKWTKSSVSEISCMMNMKTIQYHTVHTFHLAIPCPPPKHPHLWVLPKYMNICPANSLNWNSHRCRVEYQWGRAHLNEDWEWDLCVGLGEGGGWELEICISNISSNITFPLPQVNSPTSNDRFRQLDAAALRNQKQKSELINVPDTGNQIQMFKLFRHSTNKDKFYTK